MTTIWLSVVFTVGLTAHAFADEVSHRKAAAKLLETTDIEHTLERVRASVERVMRRQLETLNLTAEGRKAAAKAQQDMMAWFSEFVAWEKTKQMYVDIYIEMFTEHELNELIAFNQSPLGQKLIKKMPEIVQRSMENTQQLLRQTEPEFDRRLRKILIELEEMYRG